MKLWTVGAKVRDLDNEIAFVKRLGGELVLDDKIPFGGRTYRIPLVRWGDTYTHLAEEMVYEQAIGRTLGFGLCHLVFEVEDLEAERATALDAGASEIAPATRVTAGFGTRDVAFLTSPGGTLFELIRIIDAAVPSPR